MGFIREAIYGLFYLMASVVYFIFYAIWLITKLVALAIVAIVSAAFVLGILLA